MPYKQRTSGNAFQHCPHAQVAQLVEQRTENPRVGGSNPPLGTIFKFQAPQFAAQAIDFQKYLFEE